MTSIRKDGNKNSKKNKKNGFLCLEAATRAGWQRGQALVASWQGCVAGRGGGREQGQLEAGMPFLDGSFI